MQAKGKLLVLEAGDGSGKATQTKMLRERLVAEGRCVRQVEFPDYASPSSALVRMYLGGDFGERASEVNAYAASAFFAVDRYASFQTKWRADLEAGAIVLADRYTTANMVHQAVKLEEAAEREAFLAWLEDFEYGKLALPPYRGARGGKRRGTGHSRARRGLPRALPSGVGQSCRALRLAARPLQRGGRAAFARGGA